MSSVQQKKRLVYQRIVDEYTQIVYSPLSEYATNNEFDARILKSKKVFICCEIKKMLLIFLADTTDELWLTKLLHIEGGLLNCIYQKWCMSESIGDIEILLADIILKM